MKNLDESYQHLAASHIQKHLEALAEQLDGVRGASDIEFVHQARVASRRLRSALQMFGGCFPPKKFKRWRNSVRALTKDLGDARDLDVQIAFLDKTLQEQSPEQAETRAPGLSRLRLRLQQRRAALQPAVVSAVDALEVSGVLAEMHGAVSTAAFEFGRRNVGFQSPYVFTRAAKHIEDRLAGLRAHASCLGNPEANKEHHAMRIAAKRLRYTLEICAPAYDGALDEPIKKAKKLQTLLGDMHDCDVWGEELARFLVQERERTLVYFGEVAPFETLRPGIEYLRTERQEARTRLFLDAVAFWEELEAARVWEELLALARARAAGECSGAEQEEHPDAGSADS